MGKLTTRILYLPRPAAKYPGCYPLHFEKHLPEILETTDYIHLFAGMSTSGFRVDTNTSVNPDLVCDVHDMPIEDNTFSGGMADPPYTKEFAETLYNTEYPRWSIWTKEMVRVVKNGGRIAVMHNYIVPRISKCKLEEIILLHEQIEFITFFQSSVGLIK